MLKSVIICTAIAATFAVIPQAHAQYATPFPGYGPLYGNGSIQGGRDYNDWQATRRDHGLDYDQSIDQRRDTYQPYSYQGMDEYGFARGSNHGHGHYDGDDD